MNRNTRAIVVVLLALVLVGGLCAGLVYLLAGDELLAAVRGGIRQFALIGRDDDLAATVSSDSTPRRFTVSSGDTPAVIARNLLAASLILDADLFVDYVRAEGLDTQLEAGTYFLNQAQTVPQIAQMLTDSRFSQITFTILPGWRIEEIADVIDANPLFGFSGAEFLAVVGPGAVVDPTFAAGVNLPAGASLEGFLFPETYQLAPETTPVGLRETLLAAFLAAVEGEVTQAAAARNLTLYEVVTMASIVQREAVRADEQPLIASVYYNRLRAGMKLDADPTVQYPLGRSRGTWWAPITQADYQGVNSPYNTYLQPGLPPGPIASPGITAIRAAVYPETSAYFYFRADCRDDGYHDFATTYEEHLANGC